MEVQQRKSSRKPVPKALPPGYVDSRYSKHFVSDLEKHDQLTFLGKAPVKRKRLQRGSKSGARFELAVQPKPRPPPIPCTICRKSCMPEDLEHCENANCASAACGMCKGFVPATSGRFARTGTPHYVCLKCVRCGFCGEFTDWNSMEVLRCSKCAVNAVHITCLQSCNIECDTSQKWTCPDCNVSIMKRFIRWNADKATTTADIIPPDHKTEVPSPVLYFTDNTAKSSLPPQSGNKVADLQVSAQLVSDLALPIPAKTVTLKSEGKRTRIRKNTKIAVQSASSHINKPKKVHREPNKCKWSTEQCGEYFGNLMPEFSTTIEKHDLSGAALYLITRTHCVTKLGLPVGVAVKFHAKICDWRGCHF